MCVAIIYYTLDIIIIRVIHFNRIFTIGFKSQKKNLTIFHLQIVIFSAIEGGINTGQFVCLSIAVCLTSRLHENYLMHFFKLKLKIELGSIKHPLNSSVIQIII